MIADFGSAFDLLHNILVTIFAPIPISSLRPLVPALGLDWLQFGSGGGEQFGQHDVVLVLFVKKIDLLVDHAHTKHQGGNKIGIEFVASEVVD